MILFYIEVCPLSPEVSHNIITDLKVSLIEKDPLFRVLFMEMLL